MENLNSEEGKMSKETLEEAAEKYADFSNDYVPLAFGSKFNETTKRDFIEGAKWMQERMYNEEEVIDLLQEMNDEPTTFYGRIAIKEWFEQFKKKQQ